VAEQELVQETEQTTTLEEKPVQEYGGSAFIVGWTIIIMAALAFLLFARLLTYEAGPLPLHLNEFALVGAGLALVFLALGYFTFTKKPAQRKAFTRRNGVMLMVLGFFMLVGHFAFSQILPVVLGLK